MPELLSLHAVGFVNPNPSLPDGPEMDIAPSSAGPMLRPFLGAAPCAIAVAGGLLVVRGATVLQSHWSPSTIALTHVTTLGFISMVLIGRTYALVPVLTGEPLRSPRLPPFVFGLFTIGIVALVSGLLRGDAFGVEIAIGTLFPALAFFLSPLLLAFRRQPAGEPRAVLRLALGALLLAAALGVWVAHGHAGMHFPGNRGLWVEVHLGIALLGWVGGFTLQWLALSPARDPNPREWIGASTLRMLVRAGIVMPVLLLALDYAGVAAKLGAGLDSRFGGIFDTELGARLGLESSEPAQLVAALLLFPAALAIWVLGPLRALGGFASTASGRDLALRWRAISALGPIVALLACVALGSKEPRAPLLFGWTAVWGWAGLIAHAVLVSHDDFADRRGTDDADAERKRIDPAFWLHLASIALGAIAIGSGSDALARATGVALLVLAALLAHSLARTWRSLDRTATPMSAEG